nr:hypothetical protein [Candidatus Sigynarchaeum springense]
MTPRTTIPVDHVPNAFQEHPIFKLHDIDDDVIPLPGRPGAFKRPPATRTSS